jgi:DNA mismatch endonuclease (patch repair protein)
MDNLTKLQRSYCMSRVRRKDTLPERVLCSALSKQGFRFQKHVRSVPGTPDIVFPRARVAVFVDGGFWHGYRFPTWRSGISPFWRQKIQSNRLRDRRNFARLRRMGWRVIRVWDHQLRKDVGRIVLVIESALATATQAYR